MAFPPPRSSLVYESDDDEDANMIEIAMKAEEILRNDRSLQHELQLRQHLENASNLSVITLKTERDVSNLEILLRGKPDWRGTIKVDTELQNSNNGLWESLHEKARQYSDRYENVTYDMN